MDDLFPALALLLFGLVIGTWIGNAQGDQATLRDCAVKGEARMTSGATIECSVKKETK